MDSYTGEHPILTLAHGEKTGAKDAAALLLGKIQPCRVLALRLDVLIAVD